MANKTRFIYRAHKCLKFGFKSALCVFITVAQCVFGETLLVFVTLFLIQLGWTYVRCLFKQILHVANIVYLKWCWNCSKCTAHRTHSSTHRKLSGKAFSFAVCLKRMFMRSGKQSSFAHHYFTKVCVYETERKKKRKREGKGQHVKGKLNKAQTRKHSASKITNM